MKMVRKKKLERRNTAVHNMSIKEHELKGIKKIQNPSSSKGIVKKALLSNNN